MRRTGLSLRIPTFRRRQNHSNDPSPEQASASTLGFPEDYVPTPSILRLPESPYTRPSNPSPLEQIAYKHRTHRPVVPRFRQSYLDRALPPEPLRSNRPNPRPTSPIETEESSVTAGQQSLAEGSISEELQSTSTTYLSDNTTSLIRWVDHRINHLLARLEEFGYTQEEQLSIVEQINNLRVARQVVQSYNEWLLADTE